MEVSAGRFSLPGFRTGPIMSAFLAVVLTACSGDTGPSADSEQAAAEARQLLAAGGSADGKSLYTACAACHGDKAEGNRALGAPSLRNQQDWYLARQLRQYRAGVRGSHPEDSYGMQMQAIANTLPDDAAVEAVVAYIADMGGKPAAATLEGNIKRGADYYSNLCGACHGPAAEGLESLQAPALAGVDDWYLLSQYLHFRDGIRGADEADKYGYQMAIMAGHLSDEAVLTDVLSYIQSLAD